jgi:diadenosine tetraphosphate (Ap4A) HIT family hydrolase
MSWEDPVAWARVKQGLDCSMCADAHLQENEFSLLVAELEYAYVRLPRNQYYRGWTVVILKWHANELFELRMDELSGFWREVALVAQALERLHQPAKINYGVFGNLCPHVHCHVVPRYVDDDPSAPLHMNEREVLLAPDAYERMIADLRDALAPGASL